MIRSLFSGVSGMKNHQIRMDVIGNNIANVNTSGYKAGRATFQDTLYQTIRSGGKSTNPAQAGLGINVAAINTFMKPGGLQSTGRTLDLAINGTGFFKVTDGVEEYYTRDGILNIDQEGYLVNSSGYRIVGELTNTATAEGEEEYARVAYPTDTTNNTETLTLRGTLKDGTAGLSLDFDIETAKSADVYAGDGYSFTTAPAPTALNLITDASGNSLNFQNGDIIEFHLVNEYTTDPTEKNKKWEFEVYDSIASSFKTISDLENFINDPATGIEEIEMYYHDSNSDSTDDGFGFRTTDVGPGVSLTVTVKDKNGNPKQVFTSSSNNDFIGGTANKSGIGDDIDSIINKINEKRNVTGVEASKGKNNNLVLTTLDRTEKATMSISGDAAKCLGLPTSGTFETERPVQTMEMKIINDSLPVGSLTILPDGTIMGTDTEGFPLKWEDGPTTAADADIARITLFGFNNQDGLRRVNKNLFEVSPSSGEAIKGTPGTPGFGTIESGYIEMSNVDLTDEFTNMITTQRGYQAGARIITVSDTMLEELINLKR